MTVAEAHGVSIAGSTLATSGATATTTSAGKVNVELTATKSGLATPVILY